MNLLLLPKELQDLISEYNVQHRPIMRLVMKELLIIYKKRIKKNKYCSYYSCYTEEDEKYSEYYIHC